MIETYARYKVQPFFDYFATWCIAYAITPLTVTTSALILGIASGVCIAYGYLYTACILLILSGLGDILDGTVARLSNKVHTFGAYCDLISDRMVESAIIVGLAFRYPEHIVAYVLFFSAVMLHFSTFVVAGTLFPNMGAKSMHYDASIVERAEAFFVFIAILLFPSHIYMLLMILNGIIFIAGITRFKRVAEYVSTYE